MIAETVTTRRKFLAGAAAAGSAPFVGAQGVMVDKPLWTAGIMTDTHVQTHRKDASLVRRACELFARHKVDLVANCGDICETYDPRGYAEIRKAYDEVFASHKPEEIWVYANHDWVRRSKEPHDAVMADVQRHLKAKNGPYASVTFRGYPIVVVPQMTWDEGKTEKMIVDAENAHSDADIPVFVFDHEAGWNTNDNTITWGTGERLRLYSRHPRVILLSGHAHSSLKSELNCYLGRYASINAGCLDRWRGDAASFTYAAKPEYGVLIMEVYRKRVVFRRFDVRDGLEYEPERPWTVTLPYVPSQDPFAWLRRHEEAPQFPKGAKLEIKTVGDPCETVSLSFPAAVSGKDYLYRVDIADERGERVACREEYGQFYLRRNERKESLELLLPSCYFDVGIRYRVSVTPCDFLRRGGRALSCGFSLERRKGEPVWDCAEPMTSCRFLQGRTGGGSLPLKDGFYQLSSRNARLVLPREIWAGAKGTRFRFIVDCEMRIGRSPWTFVLCNSENGRMRPVNARIYTPRDPAFRQRIIVDFAKPAENFAGELMVKEGGAGQIRFLRLRLETNLKS